jgi:hypothetical protein
MFEIRLSEDAERHLAECVERTRKGPTKTLVQINAELERDPVSEE